MSSEARRHLIFSHVLLVLPTHFTRQRLLDQPGIDNLGLSLLVVGVRELSKGFAALFIWVFCLDLVVQQSREVALAFKGEHSAKTKLVPLGGSLNFKLTGCLENHCDQR